MDRIIVPLETEAPERETYAHHIARHRLDDLGTFVGEALLASELFVRQYIYQGELNIEVTPELYLNDMPEEERLQLIRLREQHGRSQEIMEQTSWFHEEPVPAPAIVWHPREQRRNLFGDFLARLYHTGITQLTSVYETYIADIAGEIYRIYPELLPVSERQITTGKILELGDYEKILDVLIQRSVNKLVFSVSYPKLVQRFNSEFHIGIHDKNSPASEFDIHHLIEKRNIIVHNNGVASNIYVEKLQDYNRAEILNEGDELIVDFKAFFGDLFKVRELIDYIESRVVDSKPNMRLFGYRNPRERNP